MTENHKNDPTANYDYRNIDYDPGKPPEEWSFQARRAYLLERIEEAGHPDFINQSEVAREFGKDPSTINRDIKRLQTFVTEGVNEQRLDHIGVTLYETAIKDEISQDNWGAADRLFQNWTEWLDTRGLADYLPDDEDDDGDTPDSVGEIQMEIAGVSDLDLDETDDGDPDDDEEDDDGQPQPVESSTTTDGGPTGQAQDDDGGDR